MKTMFWVAIMNNSCNEHTTLVGVFVAIYIAQLFFLLLDIGERTIREILIGLIPIVSLYYVIKKL
jgi:hypothetical protein